MPTVEEIMARDGCSRATAYRRMKEEAALPEIVPTDITEPLPQVSAEAIREWCHAVFWVAKNINVSRMTKKKAGSEMAYSLWQYAKEHQSELHTKLMPLAMNKLKELDQKEDQSEMVEAEAMDIAELEKLLDAALEDAALAS